MAPIGRPDPLWTVNVLLRGVTQGNRDCVWTVARLVTSIVQLITDNFALSEIRKSITTCSFTMPISLETLQVQSQCLVACCAYLEIQPSTCVPIHGDTGDDGDALELTSEGQMNNFQSQRFLEGTTMYNRETQFCTFFRAVRIALRNCKFSRRPQQLRSPPKKTWTWRAVWLLLCHRPSSTFGQHDCDSRVSDGVQ